jgi:hypothetical protein
LYHHQIQTPGAYHFPQYLSCGLFEYPCWLRLFYNFQWAEAVKWLKRRHWLLFTPDAYILIFIAIDVMVIKYVEFYNLPQLIALNYFAAVVYLF